MKFCVVLDCFHLKNGIAELFSVNYAILNDQDVYFSVLDELAGSELVGQRPVAVELNVFDFV